MRAGATHTLHHTSLCSPRQPVQPSHMVHTTVDMEFRERAKLFVERKSFLERFRHRRPQKSNSEAPMKVKTKEKSKLIHDIKLFHD